MVKRKTAHLKPRPLTEEEMAMVRSLVEGIDDNSRHYTVEELLTRMPINSRPVAKSGEERQPKKSPDHTLH